MPMINPLFGQNNATYQQLLQQYMQNSMQPQQGVTTFINVPSEEAARRADVPPNSTRNFINENEGYVYMKSVGMSEFMTKTDFEPYKKIISEMQSVAEELKG